MKFFAALAISMCFVSVTIAQNTVSEVVNATANVQSKLIVSEAHALDFGLVDNVSGQFKKISVLGIATTGGNALSATTVHQGVGLIKRTGSSVVTYKLVSPPAELIGTITPGSKLPITGYETAFNFADNTTGQSAGNLTVTNETTVPGTGGTDIYVHIGATVTPSGDTTSPETHTATITLSAEYN